MSAAGPFPRKKKAVKHRLKSSKPEFEHEEYEAASKANPEQVLLIYSNVTSLIIKWVNPLVGKLKWFMCSDWLLRRRHRGLSFPVLVSRGKVLFMVI